MTGKILILAGLIMMAIGIFFGYTHYNFIHSSVKTEARVKSIINQHQRVIPVWEYTVKGKHYEFEGAATNSDQYKIGDKEILYYDPSDPEDSKKGTFMDLWFLPVFLSGFGFILGLVGLVVMLSFKNKRPAFTIKRPGEA